MQLTTAFLVGLFAAITALAALIYLDGMDALLGFAPVIAMIQVALFVETRRRWAYRAARSLIGAVVSGVCALIAVMVLKNVTDWYDYPADSGAWLYLAMLACIAAIPGAAAAASPSPRAGAAMGVGFGVGLCAWLWRAPQPVMGVVVLLGVGIVVGTVLSAATVDGG